MFRFLLGVVFVGEYKKLLLFLKILYFLHILFLHNQIFLLTKSSLSAHSRFFKTIIFILLKNWGGGPKGLIRHVR